MRRNKMMCGLKSSTIFLISMLFISLMATSLVPYTSSAEEEMMYGGTLKVAILEEPSDEIMPLSATDESDLSIVDLMYDSLAIRDVESGRMIPCIAEEWEIDDMNVTITLKEGIEFWNGDELTASDVIYSYENYQGDLSTPIDGINSTGDYSIRFTLSELNPAFFMTEGLRVPIVQEGNETLGTGPFTDFNKETAVHSVEGEVVREATDRDINKTEINLVHGFLSDVTIYETVNGIESEVPSSEYDIDMDSGKITSFPYTAESTITADYSYSMTYCNVTTNEDYFQGRAYIDGISFKLYNKVSIPKAKNYLGSNILGPAEDKAAGAINDMANDKLDMIKPVYPSDYIAFIDATYMNLLTVNKNEFVYAAYNSSYGPFNKGENNVTNESATAFRRAIDFTYNRDNYVNNVLGGMALSGASTVSPADTQWYNPDVTSHPYKLDKADEIMEQAGYFDWDADGWKELPDGDNFKLDVNYPGIKVDSVMATVGSTLAGDGGFNDVYVESEPHTMGFAGLDENETNGEYDVSINKYKSALDPGRNMYELFHANGSKNFINYNYTDFNHAIRDANKILDLGERKAAVQELQEIYMDKVPMSIIYFPAKYHVYRNDLYTGWKTGFPFGPDNKQNYLSVHKMTEESLQVSISSIKSISSGSSISVTVVVNDQYGTPISDASVDLSVNTGSLDQTSLTTGSTGQARFTYTPPDIDSGLTDIVFSADASKGTNTGEGFSMATVHPPDQFFSLDVSISESEIESGGTADVDVSFDQTLQEYPAITLTLIPSTGSVWLEDTNNVGSEGQVFTTTLHTEDVKTDLSVIVKAEASIGDFSEEDDDSIDVAAIEASNTGTGTTTTSSEGGGEMMLYAGAGALLLVIIIIIVSMFMMGKDGKKPVKTSDDAEFFEDEGDEGFFFDEKEEDLGEEEMFEEEEEAFEEEEVSEEDLFEEEPDEEELAEEDIFEDEEPVEEEFEEDIEEEPQELEDEKDTSEEDEVFEG